jgi:penicillin-binding protein 2
MVSLPSYDNNQFAVGISTKDYQMLIENPDQPLFNRSVSGEFPSGSTIKPVMAAAALQERVVSENTKFQSSGGLRIGQWFFPDWQAGGHGSTDVRKAIAQSVNTYFYYIGGGYEEFQGLGVERIVRYGKLFGLGEQTGIDLPGEAKGFLPTPDWKKEAKGEPWYIGDTYHLSIGQGDLLVTPLQVAMYTAAFANGGTLFRPHLVKTVLFGDDRIMTSVKEEPIREKFIDEYDMQVVRDGMRQTVLSGSARSMQSVPVPVAGKTGTAQWSSKKDPHAWFTGFAPYDNPAVAITVLIEEGEEGSSVAVPVAREFLTWYFGGQDSATGSASTTASASP